MLVLVRSVRETLGARFDDEPGRAVGGHRENRVAVRDAAVADPLLGAADPVAGHGPVLADALRRRLQRAEIAAGLGLGGAVGEQDAVLRDPAHVDLLLLLGAADPDRIAAEERGELGGREPQIDRRHPLADAIHVECPAAHPAVLERHEQQLDPEFLSGGHPPDDLLGELVSFIKIDQQRIWQLA